MAGTIHTTFETELILKLTELNNFTEFYTKYHLIDKLLHKVGIIFNFENLNITWKKVSISMKPPNCTAKEFFVIKESCPVRDAPKRINQILDAEYKKINSKSIVMNLNYLKNKHKIFL